MPDPDTQQRQAQPPSADRYALTAQQLAALGDLLGDGGLRVDPAAIERHSRDETEDLRHPPAAVALPADPHQVAALLRYACAEGIPVTPRGAGTGLSGGALPVAGGIALSMERFDRIREIDTENLTAEVEVGVTTGRLKAAVAERGLYYPPDPASLDSCQLGGNLAEDSAGPHCCKYGTTRAWVLGLEAVLADGSIIRTGGRCRKDVTGYNLTQLLVGSEGTLAVLTAATVRLIAQPAARLVLLLPFSSLEEAAAAVAAIFRAGFDPACCELMEEEALAAVAAVEEIPAALEGAAAMLLLELDGDDGDALLEQAAALAEVTAELGAGEPLVAQDAHDQRRLWAVRRKIGEAVKSRSIYKEADTVVPRSALADVVRAARAAAERHGLTAICYGHAGDGNLHVNLLKGDLDDALWPARRDAAEDHLFRRVVELGGRLSGEHGIGLTQRRLLPLALEPAQIALMRRLKAAFDPAGILNPGKIFPE